MKRFLSILLISISCTLLPATGVFGQQNELQTVPKVDLNRYSGKWYEIARYPNRFEKACRENVTAEYKLKPNGRIEVKNSCVKAGGKTMVAIGEAKVVDKTTNAKLDVRFAPSFLSFLPMVWGDYWIIDLDADYDYVAIGDPKRTYFWILSRNKTIDEKTYQGIVNRVQALGFDPKRIEKTLQNWRVFSLNNGR